MRYSAEHKEETHERIVRTASRRFRRSGASVGIADLMKALKLTHGGFYRHFRSKDDLLVEALQNGFDDMRQRMSEAIAKVPPGRELESLIETYLSDRHCADAAGGCPVAALAAESPGGHARFGRHSIGPFSIWWRRWPGSCPGRRKRSAGGGQEFSSPECRARWR